MAEDFCADGKELIIFLIVFTCYRNKTADLYVAYLELP